jgi:2-aminoadipate transaminase
MSKPPSVLAAPLPSSGAAERVGSSAIRDLLHLTQRPEVISLAGGLPSPHAFPVEAIATAAAEVLQEGAEAALQYSTTEGDPMLRAWVAQRSPVTTVLDEVLVTNGSQQALDLLVRATVEPGGTIALADPGYVGAIQAFRQAGAALAGIPADGDGLRVDVLADRLAAGLRPVLVYVVAEFDNPSGATLSAERRRELARLADHYGFLIVEDDPYGALRWAGSRLPALRTLSERVVTLGTTSKILAPGLRVGWAVAPAPLAARLVVLKQAADLHTASLNQAIAVRVLTRPGFLEPHLDGLRERYHRQSEALQDGLRARLGDRVAFHAPEGGMFLWARLLDGTDTAALLPRALEAGMAFVPGNAFAVQDPQRCGLRLSFATEDPQALAEAVRRLETALAV